MAGKKGTRASVQNKLDSIQRLIAAGASDRFIIDELKIKRAQFFNYKAKLEEQIAQIWKDKTEQDYSVAVQICQDRLIADRTHALDMRNQTKSPLWGAIASELAVSILKLEAEGIMAVKNNGRLKRLEEKAGYLRYDGPRTTLPPGSSDRVAEALNSSTAEPEPRTEDPNRVA